MSRASDFPRSLRALAMGGLLWAAAGCAGVVNSAGDKLQPLRPSKRVISARQVANELYRLQPNDELEVLLSSRPESGLHLQIRDDGAITYPAAGTFQAAGKTIPELEKEIQDRLVREEPLGGAKPSAAQSTEEISPEEAVGQLYRLQPGDQLDIAVWNYTDLSKKVQLREDGAFVFPLIGTVSAADRTLPDLEREITQRLDRDYVINPQVSARLAGAQFSILGMTGGETGGIPLDGSTNLLTAISKAGDIDALRSSRVEIIRRLGNKRYVIKTEVDRVLRGKEPNFPVLPRDTIYLQLADAGRVTLRLADAKFTALGEIASPGLHPIEGTLDLLTAVSIAGGITKFGSNQLEIIRLVGNQRLVIRANVDRVLQGREPNLAIFPRDTIYVKRRLF